MQKEKVLRFFKNKGTVGVLTLLLVGVVAFATYRTSYQEPAPDTNLIAEKEQDGETETEEKNLEAAGQDVVAELKSTGDYTDANEMDVDPASLIANQDSQAADMDETEPAVDANASTVTAVLQPTVNFQADSMLTWPAAGTVLMDYDMDSTVYFRTLDQYKYNPALIIGSAVGNPVIASAKGIVQSIAIDEETGTTLTLNLGNNYALIYGQLKEVTVNEGDVVEQGQLLGYVSEPTKYYVEEGSNLYFQMQKDGKPVDPLLYLE